MTYYARDGQRLTYEEAVRPEVWDMASRRVGDDTVGGYQVSTVHIVLDHSHGGPTPIIFETMLFGDGEYDQWYERYSTEAEALAGHARMVESLRTTGAPPVDDDELPAEDPAADRIGWAER